MFTSNVKNIARIKFLSKYNWNTTENIILCINIYAPLLGNKLNCGIEFYFNLMHIFKVQCVQVLNRQHLVYE